jgi:hypothetical protein
MIRTDTDTDARLPKLRPEADDYAEAREYGDRAAALRRIAKRYRDALDAAPHCWRASDYRRRIDALHDTASWWR